MEHIAWSFSSNYWLQTSCNSATPHQFSIGTEASVSWPRTIARCVEHMLFIYHAPDSIPDIFPVKSVSGWWVKTCQRLWGATVNQEWTTAGLELREQLFLAWYKAAVLCTGESFYVCCFRLFSLSFPVTLSRLSLEEEMNPKLCMPIYSGVSCLWDGCHCIWQNSFPPSS